jgi:putative iron-regulated protein
VSGPGFCELVGRYDPALAQKLKKQIAQSLEAVKAIPPPFDTAILGADEAPSRKAISRAITSLQQQTQTLAEAAATMQLKASAHEARR